MHESMHVACLRSLLPCLAVDGHSLAYSMVASMLPSLQSQTRPLLTFKCTSLLPLACFTFSTASCPRPSLRHSMSSLQPRLARSYAAEKHII